MLQLLPKGRPDLDFVPAMDVYSFGAIMYEVATRVDLAKVDAYCLRLETLLEDRMKDLRTERRMTDQLLQSMLPKSVVEQLRLGHSIVPEAFEQCTIYFSDIVGFTSLSAKSTPLEVVGLLNKLYTEFDEVIDRYDVYKVETIGDAYMVASGVPRRNGCRHATAITDMSLDLVNVSRNFVIPHMPQEPLKIRVGIHSGLYPTDTEYAGDHDFLGSDPSKMQVILINLKNSVEMFCMGFFPAKCKVLLQDCL
ncbi:guanylyl cyclase GC-E [Clonorchis sinensis]|uniref:guanylate cyclase n=1 Tax=Clonorchis sinensis TaxID=79923 RepID=G7YQY7_CLOSI|nr:guanylyl cyclase GC-E [Clonorchis sinensis]